MLAQFIRDPRLRKIRLWSQGRAGHGQTAGHQLDKVHIRLRPLQKSDLHQCPVIGQRFQIALNIRAAHHIEDEVRPAERLHFFNKINVAVVEGGLCPQSFAGAALFSRSGGRKHPCTKSLGKLDRRCPDPGTATMDQKPLPALQSAAHENIGPDGEEGLGQAGRLFQAQRAGNGQTMRRRGGHIFRIAASGQKRADLIADLPLRDTRTFRHDLSRGFQPRQIARPFRRIIKTCPLQRIGAVHTGIGHLDHDLIMGRFGHGPVRDGQHLWPAGPGYCDGFHGRSS